MKSPTFLLFFFVALLLASFGLATVLYLPAYAQSAAANSLVQPVGKPIQRKAALGLPPIPIPADNPRTDETIALGRRLYYDPQLSVDGTISCASCHAPRFAFSNRRPFVGADTRGNLNDLGRNTVTNVETDTGCFKTPSLRNLANGGPYMHDGSFRTVKDLFARYIGGDNWTLISPRRFTRSMFSPSTSATNCCSSSIRSTASFPTVSVRPQTWPLP